MVLWFFYNLVLGLSMGVTFCSDNWLFIWAFLELITILVISLMGVELSPRVVEGMTKYYIIQAVASAILLLGLLCRYYLGGDLEVFSYYGGFSFVLILVGLFMKIAVLPNPFWFIDVVSGMGVLRGFYVMMTSKLVPLYLYITMSNSISVFLIVVGVGTVAMGSLLGVNQTSVRKMMALSSVAHLGWLILGFSTLTQKGCFFIFLCYIVTVLPMIWMAGFYEMEDLSKIKRCYFQPWFLFLLVISLLSLGGFPPMIGFIYKWVMFIGLFKSGSFIVCGYLIMMSIVSLFFYLRLCYLLYSVYWPEEKTSIVGGYITFPMKTSAVWGLMMISSSLLFLSFFCMGPLGLF